jgi:hypothetical protein
MARALAAWRPEAPLSACASRYPGLVGASRHCPACDGELDDRLWCARCRRHVTAWLVRLDGKLIGAGREPSRECPAAVLVAEEMLEGLASLARGPGILEPPRSFAEPRPAIRAAELGGRTSAVADFTPRA